MSRQTWLDRTIAAARDAEVTMPWVKKPLSDNPGTVSKAAKA